MTCIMRLLFRRRWKSVFWLYKSRRFCTPWRTFSFLFMIYLMTLPFLPELGGKKGTPKAPSYARSQHFITVSYLSVMRMGNEMFVYASLLGISHSYPHLTPVMPGWLKIRKIFNLTMKERDYLPLGAHYMYNSKKANTFDTGTLQYRPPFSISIQGYLQSWKYFVDVEQLIRKEFTFQIHILNQVEDRLKDLTPKSLSGKEVVRVGVHVRHGDMTIPRNGYNGYTIADAGYLARATAYFRQRYKRVLFVVCSDDMPWSKRKIHGEDVVFSEGTDYIVDFAMLATSDHVIMTVGTFGWWAAWLANGTTVYYKDWPRPGSKLWDEVTHLDYFPPNWIGM